MSKNMGAADRLIRVLFAVAVAVLYFTDTVAGTLGIILGIFAVILLATSAMSFCPLYTPFKISTMKKSEKPA